MKRKICLILALLMLAMLCLSACDEEKGNENDPQTSTTANSQSGSQPQIDVSGYSQILQNILLDEHYSSMISQVEATHRFDIWETGVFEPHPYAFFETEGFDVEAIKNDKIEAYTMSYVLDEEPNNLYIYTRVMQDNSYWTNYLLKYELTEQEMKDYHMLHNRKGRIDYFIEAVLMNNEISKTRKPEIIGKSNISIEAFDNMTENYQFSVFSDTKKINVIFLNPNKENLTFDMFLIPRFNERYQICFTSKVVEFNGTCKLMEFDRNIYLRPTKYDMLMDLNNRIDHTATYYFSQDAKMNYICCESFKNVQP